MEVLQTPSGRPKGTAKGSHGEAGTGLKESAGAPGNPLLLHSPIPAQHLLAHAVWKGLCMQTPSLDGILASSAIWDWAFP